MLLFYNSNGDLLKSVLEPVYQGSNRANEIYLIAPLSANNTVWATYTWPNGEVGHPKLMVITQAPESIPDNAFGSFRVWRLLLDSNITKYVGDVKMSFFASNNLGQDETNITFEEIFIPIKKGSSISLPSGSLPSNIFGEIIIYLGEIQSSIMKNADDIEALTGEIDGLTGDIEALKESTKTNKNNIEALTQSVNTQQLSINNAVSNAKYAKETSIEAKEVAEDSFTVSASNTTKINQNATRINQLNDKIAVLEGANAYLIVSELPTANINPKIIYLLPATDSENNNVYEEYIYVNNKWELIGTTKNDLTNLNYDYLLNTPIYNSYNGLDYEPSEAVFNPLPKPCYMRFTGETDTSRGLETGKIYYVTQVGAVINYAPIDGSKPVTYYNDLTGIPIYLSDDGSIAGTGENLINLQPGDYFKYTGNGVDGKGLTNGVIYLIGTKEVEGVIMPTYTPINGRTKVLVNGEVVEEFDADTKLDKIDSPGGVVKAYCVANNQALLMGTDNSGVPLAGYIPRFTNRKTLVTEKATNNFDCVNLKQFNEGLLYKHNITITGKYRTSGMPEESYDIIVIRGYIIKKSATLITLQDVINASDSLDSVSSGYNLGMVGTSQSYEYIAGQTFAGIIRKLWYGTYDHSISTVNQLSLFADGDNPFITIYEADISDTLGD